MPNLLAGVLVPPSHLGKANTHLAKKITKPFVKAARFISKKLNIAQVKPQNSYTQPKKTQLSKAAQRLLSEVASSTFHAPSAKRPKPVTKTDAFTDSNASVASAKTHKAHNKSKATTYLRDIALNPRAKAVSHSSLKNEERERLVQAKHSLNHAAISTEIDQNKNARLTADALKDAVKAADLKALKHLLSTVNLEKQITQKLSNELLMLAARQGSVEVLNLLLNQDQIKVDTQIGQKLLLIAGEHKNTEIVDSLLSDKVFVKTIFSPNFIQFAVINGMSQICGKLIQATRFLHACDDYGYIRYCIEYAEDAIKNGHKEIVPSIMHAGGYRPGENKAIDSKVLWTQVLYSHRSNEFLNFLLQDERFDPSVSNNARFYSAIKKGRSDIVLALLKDIRVFKSLDRMGVKDLIPILQTALQDRAWQPKFSFTELKSVINTLLRSNSWNQQLTQNLVRTVKSGLKVRHAKAVSEAEAFAKVFFEKGFDENFVISQVTEFYGFDLFPLQDHQTKNKSIKQLVLTWQAQSNIGDEFDDEISV